MQAQLGWGLTGFDSTSQSILGPSLPAPHHVEHASTFEGETKLDFFHCSSSATFEGEAFVIYLLVLSNIVINLLKMEINFFHSNSVFFHCSSTNLDGFRNLTKWGKKKPKFNQIKNTQIQLSYKIQSNQEKQHSQASQRQNKKDSFQYKYHMTKESLETLLRIPNIDRHPETILTHLGTWGEIWEMQEM